VGAVREIIRAGKIPVVRFDRKTSRNLTYKEVTGKAGMSETPRILTKCERGDLNPYGVTRWILSAKIKNLQALDIRSYFP
jgi:hypothetical protein